MRAVQRNAAHPYSVALRPSEAAVAGSRGIPAMVRVRATELADLHDELHALRSERDAIAAELVQLRNLLTYAFGVEGWHIALNVRDRLGSLSARLDRRAA